MGPLAAIVNLFLAFPLAYVGMRHGLVAALSGLLLVTLIQLQIAGSVSGFGYLLQFGAASVLLPMLLRNGVAWFRSVVICLLLTAVLVTAGGVGYAHRHQTTTPEIVATYIDGEVAAARQVYEQADLPEEQLQNLFSVLDTTALFFHQAYVGLALTAFGVLLVMTVAMLKIAPQRNYSVPGELFHHLKVPEGLVWLLIVAGFSLLLNHQLAQQVALNVLTVLLPLYFLQGVAIITFFFKKKAFSTLSRVFGYLLILVINPLPLLVMAIGVFDMWFDFRKPRVKTT
ncbi:MAG: DUF2232 domain-containing protein [Desulfuromonas sp.]|nr:DUF2232 domain-containing protein [Desulfuromonas sp.]